MDSLSKYMIAFKNKERVVAHLTELKTALGGFAAILQSDNGGEFDNAEVNAWCKANDVKFVTSLPYSPWVQGQVLSRSTRPLSHDKLG